MTTYSYQDDPFYYDCDYEQYLGEQLRYYSNGQGNSVDALFNIQPAKCSHHEFIHDHMNNSIFLNEEICFTHYHEISRLVNLKNEFHQNLTVKEFLQIQGIQKFKLSDQKIQSVQLEKTETANSIQNLNNYQETQLNLNDQNMKQLIINKQQSMEKVSKAVKNRANQMVIDGKLPQQFDPEDSYLRQASHYINDDDIDLHYYYAQVISDNIGLTDAFFILKMKKSTIEGSLNMDQLEVQLTSPSFTGKGSKNERTKYYNMFVRYLALILYNTTNNKAFLNPLKDPPKHILMAPASEPLIVRQDLQMNGIEEDSRFEHNTQKTYSPGVNPHDQLLILMIHLQEMNEYVTANEPQTIQDLNSLINMINTPKYKQEIPSQIEESFYKLFLYNLSQIQQCALKAITHNDVITQSGEDSYIKLLQEYIKKENEFKLRVLGIMNQQSFEDYTEHMEQQTIKFPGSPYKPRFTYNEWNQLIAMLGDEVD